MSNIYDDAFSRKHLTALQSFTCSKSIMENPSNALAIKTRTDFTTFSSFLIFDFEQVNAGWDISCSPDFSFESNT